MNYCSFLGGCPSLWELRKPENSTLEKSISRENETGRTEQMESALCCSIQSRWSIDFNTVTEMNKRGAEFV